MKYTINPSELTSTIPFPSSVVDRYLKFCKAEHIKVLLYIFRKMAVGEVSEISSETGVSEYDVNEALFYWADTGVLLPVNKSAEVKKNEVRAVPLSEKPTHSDVIRRGNEDPKIAYLLGEATIKLGKICLSENAKRSLVWLYDDLGLDVSVILYIIEYAVSQDKANLRFIEALAVDWVNKGITNISEAEEEIKRRAQVGSCWNIVCSAFGLEKRKASQKEEEAAFTWLCEWQMSRDLIEAAYDECVNTKSKFIFAYTSKILENWHNAGIKTAKDLEKYKLENVKTDGAAYDIDLYERMLNTKD